VELPESAALGDERLLGRRLHVDRQILTLRVWAAIRLATEMASPAKDLLLFED
jgi:hypothetical protein